MKTPQCGLSIATKPLHYSCTLPKGHPGDIHVATFSSGEVISIWKAVKEEILFYKENA